MFGIAAVFREVENLTPERAAAADQLTVIDSFYFIMVNPHKNHTKTAQKLTKITWTHTHKIALNCPEIIGDNDYGRLW